MGVITNVPWNTAISWVPNSTIERNPVSGHLWAMVQTAPTVFHFYRSNNNGTSWTDTGSWTISGVYQNGEIRFDSGGTDIHWVYLRGDSGNDQIWYKRIPIDSGGNMGASGALQIYASDNDGVPGKTIPALACQPYRTANGTVHVHIAQTFTTSTSGLNLYAVTIKNDAARTTTINNGIVSGTRGWTTSGDFDLVPSMDVEHTGDGYTSSTPNIWVTWESKTVVYGVKLTWGGAAWSGPSSPTTIKTGVPSHQHAPCRWDGTRLLVATVNPNNLNRIDVHERNKANTSTTTRTTSTDITGGNPSSYMACYNHLTQDIRVFAANATSIYTNDYIRASGTWTGWVAAIAATYPGNIQHGWSVRRSTAGNFQYDYVQIDGPGAGPNFPYRYINVPVNFSPTAPTWQYTGKGNPGAATAAFDVGQPLFLDWAHNDPRGDAQGSYALSRQIGAAAVQYWRASDSTWQAAEVQNTTATTAVTLTAAQWPGAGGATDATHIYKVKTWDAGGLPSPYSTAQNIIPSTHIDPTLTAPTWAQVLTAASVTATWTVAEQASYRVTLLSAAAADEFGRTVSNGWGTADLGGAWTTSGGAAGDYSVSAGTGRHSHAAVNTPHETKLGSVSLLDTEFRFTLTGAATATGASVETELRARYVDANNYVGCRILLTTTGAVQLTLRQVLAGAETSTTTTVVGITGPGPHAIRFSAFGAGLFAKAWNPAFGEPNGYDISFAITHMTAGPVAVRSLLTTGNTNTLPYVLQYDLPYVYPVTGFAYDSGYITEPSPATPTMLSHTPPMVLADGTTAVLTLTTRNIEGLSGPTRYALIVVDFIEPALPDITAITPDPDDGGIYVTVTQPAPTGGQPDTTRIDLVRRTIGDTGAGLRIVAGVTTGQPILDWRTLSGVPYEYAAIAYGQNNTVIQSGWESS